MDKFFLCFSSMQITLVLLKLYGEINWPWIGVLFPAWAVALGFIVALILMIGGFLVYDFIMRFKR